MWSIPEPVPSLPVRVSVGEAYQPLRIPGVSVAVVVGVVWSPLTVIECTSSTLPALSVDQYVTTCEPSVESVNGAVYVCAAPPSTVYCVDATPEPPELSVAGRVPCTGTRYQPFAPVGAAGDSDDVVVGATP